MDVLYYDAFGPDNQPEMWSDKVLAMLVEKLNTGGVLVAYCAKGTIRRALKQCGFYVNKLQGSPAKRENLQTNKRIM